MEHKPATSTTQPQSQPQPASAEERGKALQNLSNVMAGLTVMNHGDKRKALLDFVNMLRMVSGEELNLQELLRAADEQRKTDEKAVDDYLAAMAKEKPTAK